MLHDVKHTYSCALVHASQYGSLIKMQLETQFFRNTRHISHAHWPQAASGHHCERSPETRSILLLLFSSKCWPRTVCICYGRSVCGAGEESLPTVPRTRPKASQRQPYNYKLPPALIANILGSWEPHSQETLQFSAFSTVKRTEGTKTNSLQSIAPGIS